MYQLRRRIIKEDPSDTENEIILEENISEHQTLSDAIFELGKARKADRALYRLLVNYNPIIECDDWHDDVYYSFTFGDVTVKCELLDAMEIAEDIYRFKQ